MGQFPVTSALSLPYSGSPCGRLVFGQDCVQVPTAEDQHPVKDLSAQGADEALAGCVAPHRQLHRVRVIGAGASG
jgi:hypothetical protein